jgi:hypothetical protein
MFKLCANKPKHTNKTSDIHLFGENSLINNQKQTAVKIELKSKTNLKPSPILAKTKVIGLYESEGN